MGGLAFSSGVQALHTPRLPALVYHQMRDKFHTLLREVFFHVATPIEGPGKRDFGDIDILVATEKQPVENNDGTRGSSPKQLLATIQQALQADRAIFNGAEASVNLAIPWPAEIASTIDGAAETTQAIGDESLLDVDSLQPHFIQVDVRICASTGQMQWILFKHAHGDFWSIMGSTIRPFGLTADEIGFYIRIPEIEDNNRKLAKVFLTDEPKEVLRFLGLEIDSHWDKPFATADDLYEYAASSKFFWIDPEVKDGEHGDGVHENGQGTTRLTVVIGQGTVEDAKMQLKSNDRRRMNQRPVFRGWIEEFIPQCREKGRFLPSDPEMTRERVRVHVRGDAFACFPGVEEEYMNRLTVWMEEKSKNNAISIIKDTVPHDLEPQRRGNLITALKKIILMDDESFGILPERPLKTPGGMYLIEDIRNWITENWQGVYEIAWQKQIERAREGMALKQAKKEKADKGEV